MKYISKDNGLTYITVTHKNYDEVLTYLEKVHSLTDCEILMILICDGIVDLKFKLRADKSSIKVLFNNKNVGKLASLLRWKDEISTNRFKIIDSDDCINYKDAKLLHYKAKDFKNNFFYLHKAAKVYKDSELFGEISTNNNVVENLLKISKDVKWSIPPNAKAIYNTFILFIPNPNKLKRQNFYNDDFLSILNILFTKGSVNIELRPYIQFHSRGQTSRTSKARYLDLKTLNSNIHKTLSNSDFAFNRVGNINWKILERRRVSQKRTNNIKFSFISDLKIQISSRKLLKYINSNLQKENRSLFYEKINENSAYIISDEIKAKIFFPDKSTFYGLKEITEDNQIYDLSNFFWKRNDIIFIDIGSNVGLSTIWAKENFGIGTPIISYEPSRTILNYYEINTKKYNYIELNNKAVSNKVEILDFYYSESNGSSTTSISMLNSKHKLEDKIESQSIYEIIENARKNNSNKIFLKIDIEGGEDKFLSDIKFLEELNKVSYFMFELHGLVSKQLRQLKLISKYIDERRISFDFQFNFPARKFGIKNYRKIFGTKINWKFLEEQIINFEK